MSASRLISFDPYTGDAIADFALDDARSIDAACHRARAAFSGWALTPLAERRAIAQRFAETVRARRDEIATLIARETGKPMWEALTEADSVAAKVAISIRAQDERAGERAEPLGDATARLAHRPHGVLAVIGPFNFPMHLANGHIVPALLAGNAVVFKPSEKTPACGQLMGELWRAAGLPGDVLTVVIGGAEAGEMLVRHEALDGVLFTGGAQAGRAIHCALAEAPHKILALELGGNAPLVVWDVADIEAAAHLIVQSAYVTAGQRCTCARRLILPQGRSGDVLLEALTALIDRLMIGGPFQSPAPFMGTVIDARAAGQVLAAQSELLSQGGRALRQAAVVEARPALLSPGLIEATDAPFRDDEIFGPLLQVRRAADFDAALALANATRFGLAAGLISDDEALYRRFWTRVRAGIVNWNRPTTGASSAAPFGGVGWSGNHRPSAYYAADYSAYPVAGLESPSPAYRLQIGLNA